MECTSSNEWIKRVGDIATVGITKKASSELDEVSFIELPTVGARLNVGDTAIVVESTKAAIDFSFQIEGEVIEVNEELRKRPALLLEDPEGQGWLFKCRV